MEQARLSVAVTFYVPAGIIAIVLALGIREWRLFRAPTDDVDLFPYTVSRLIRRMVGLALLAALALTLASMGRWPPQTVTAAARYFSALTGLLEMLVVLLLYDLWALGRTQPRRRSPRGEHRDTL